MNNIDWKLYSLLEEKISTVELYLGSPDHSSSFDASTGAAVYYTKESIYLEKGILLEFLVHFGKTFRPSPSQTIPKLKKITLFLNLHNQPNAKPYPNEILEGVSIGKILGQEEIEKYKQDLEEKGIRANFSLNDKSELSRVILESHPEKVSLLEKLKIEEKTNLIPQFKLETEWQSKAHTWEVTGLHYLKEKDFFISISKDSTCKYWSLSSSNYLKTYQITDKWKPGFSALGITNSEKEVLIGDHAGQVTKWNLENLSLEKFPLSKKDDYVAKIIWVNENLFLASVLHDSIFAYSISEKKILYKIQGKLAFDFFPFAVHLEKKEFVNGNNLGIYRLETGEKIGKLPEKLGYLFSVVEIEFSISQKILCIVTDEKILLVNYETKELIHEEKIKRGIGSDTPIKIKFILEDKYLLASAMGYLKVFDLESKKTIVDIYDLEIGARSLSFIESHNLILVGSWEGRILGFELYSGKKVKIWGGHKELVYSVAAYNDKSLFLTGDSGGYLYFWDRTTKELIHFYQIHNSTITTIEVLPDGNILTGSWDKIVKISNLDGKTIWQTKGEDWIYNAFWVNTKTSVLFSNKEGLIQLIDFDKNPIYQIQLTFQHTYHAEFTTLTYCELSEQFAFYHENWIYIHDIHTGQEIHKLEIKGYFVRIQFSPDGGLLFLSDHSGNIHCITPDKGEILAILRGHTDGVSHFHFYEDWMVTTGKEEKVFLWNWKTLEFLATANHSAGGVSPVAILDKTQILCSGKDGNLILKKIVETH